MLKFIQKWLHNNFLKKYGFGWLYRDFLLLTDEHVTYVYGTVRYSFLYVNHGNTCILKKM
jgi:hypothetical protein